MTYCIRPWSELRKWIADTTIEREDKAWVRDILCDYYDRPHEKEVCRWEDDGGRQ